MAPRPRSATDIAGTNPNRLRPIQVGRVWTATVEHLKGLIDSGTYPPGTRLPAERRLAEELHISRGSLRQALGVLESIGYVTVRQGSGVYVLDRDAMEDAPLQRWLYENHELISALFDLRLAVEPLLVDALARHHEPETLQRLEETISDLDAATTSGDLHRAIAADAEFHRVIAQDAGGGPVADLVRSVQHLAGPERRAGLRLPGQLATSVREHRRILEAIRAGDRTRACQQITAHLSKAKRYASAYAQQSPD